jgi:hypothetical protein
LIPCHRVIGKDGSLTGYGGGLWRKRLLLELERTGRLPGSEENGTNVAAVKLSEERVGRFIARQTQAAETTSQGV